MKKITNLLVVNRSEIAVGIIRACRELGIKISAWEIANHLGILVIPGSGMVQSLDEATPFAEKIGYPLLLRAAAGRGGRRMRIAREPEDLKMFFPEARAEAQAAFGDGRLYLEIDWRTPNEHGTRVNPRSLRVFGSALLRFSLGQVHCGGP